MLLSFFRVSWMSRTIRSSPAQRANLKNALHNKVFGAQLYDFARSHEFNRGVNILPPVFSGWENVHNGCCNTTLRL